MHPAIWAAVISIVVTLLLVVSGWLLMVMMRRPRQGKLQFPEEFALAVRAGRRQLSTSEIADLKRERHPLSMQINDPNTFQLIQLFGNLPDTLHRQLEQKGFLKWSVAKLDAARKGLVHQMVKLNTDMAEKSRGKLPAGMSLAALDRAETGFAVVKLPAPSRPVVSWFLLWPEAVQPMWVTVANAWPCGSSPYFQAHLLQLPSLRSEKDSELPPAG